VRAAAPLDLGPIFAGLLPWFLFSTLLLTGVTFFALRQLVVKPVEVLAEGARRVRAGEFGTRLVVPRRQDEVADLVRSFNEMTETVEGFNERLRAEVARATDEAQRAQAAAMTQRRLAAMGELAAGIAHEINNPLGGLLNAVEVLQRRDLPEDKERQYLGLLSNGLERIRTTVGQLLRFTPRDAPTAEVDLAEVCFDALALVRHRARNEGVQTLLHLPGRGPIDVTAARSDVDDDLAVAHVTGAIPSIDGARNELGQAVLNLLVNSLDAHAGATRTRASGGPPRIDVLLEESATGVDLIVADDGPGIAHAKLSHVADLFFTTKEVGKGTGLGLSMVHRTVAAAGGAVHIDSEEGKGFSVRLSFPRRGGSV
jgi:signal transduction histidine kinase